MRWDWIQEQRPSKYSAIWQFETNSNDEAAWEDDQALYDEATSKEVFPSYDKAG